MSISDKAEEFDPMLISAPALHGCWIRAEMSFAEAAATFDEWLSGPIAVDQARYRSRNTMKDCRTKIKALSKFFGKLKLNSIHLGHIRAYQKARFTNERGLWAHTAGASRINGETGLLVRIMKLGDAYTSDLEKFHQELQANECEIPKALTPEDQDKFLEVAASRPDWAIVYWYSLVALHIAFSSDEMRTLRQGDINLSHQIVAVNRKAGKNKFRRREVPLTDHLCVWALQQLMERSYRLVGQSPELYLFPFRVARNQFNGTQHMGETGIRKQFEAVRDLAGVPGFQLNGWRHTAITRFAEAGVPIATIMARAGHCSPKMTAHYTHISMQAERLAMEKITRGGRLTAAPSYSQLQKQTSRQPRSASLKPISDDLMNPAIQAEIARQVAAALKRERGDTLARAGNVIRFPGAR